MSVGGCLSSAGGDGSFSGDDTKAPPSSGPNNPPQISGSPDTAILAGDVYTFTPNASDADGDTLTFSIANKPRWASFDTASGRMSGQTFLGDVGVYDNVRISVSDGTTSTALPGFTVTVTEVGLGSMSLSWTPPTENTDGTALIDLAGYNIYYGKSRGSYPNRIRIDNPSISTYVVDNLLPDTYYVVATSFNSLGVESQFSNEAVKTVSSN